MYYQLFAHSQRFSAKKMASCLIHHPFLQQSVCKNLTSQPVPKACNIETNTAHRQVMHRVVDFTIFIVEARFGFYRVALKIGHRNLYLHLLQYNAVQFICALQYRPQYSVSPGNHILIQAVSRKALHCDGKQVRSETVEAWGVC